MRSYDYCWDLCLRWISGRQIAIVALNDSAVPRLGSGDAFKYVCNKPTSLYCSIKEDSENSVGSEVFGCLLKQWFVCHADKPHLEFGLFLSNQISVKSKGPQSIAEIVCMHLTLCNQVMATLQLDGLRICIRQQYKLLPLCRAIIMVMDERAPRSDEEDAAMPGDPHWTFDLDRLAELQTVLLVLTGSSDGLSASIDFDDIEPRSKFPVARSDFSSRNSQDVFRVSIVTAVAFVCNLLKRENEFLDTQDDYQLHDRSIDP